MDDRLSEAARRALARARAEKLSYLVRSLRSPGGRLVVVLGEAHMKLEKASSIGKEVVRSFDLRGVETFQKDQVLLGRTLGVVIQAPRLLLRALSLGAIKGSTITDAKELRSGATVELERAKRMPVGLHVASVYMTCFFTVSVLAMFAPLLWSFLPAVAAALLFVAFLFQLHLLALVPGYRLRRRPWSWIIHPFLGILTPRDILMVAGTLRMLEEHPRRGAAVVVMGRAHVSGYSALLVERHGFVDVEVKF